ncbi:MAG: hypothetical protein AAFR63_17405, partial [Cyanobacteria bacterium J06631_6]
GFDPTRLVSLVAKIITKPETQKIGQKVAEGLTQKMAARLIRNLLLDTPQPKAAPALPAAR